VKIKVMSFEQWMVKYHPTKNQSSSLKIKFEIEKLKDLKKARKLSSPNQEYL